MFQKCKPFNASETAVRLMLRYPWFMSLYYSMHLYEEPDMPMHTLATNGVSIWVDPTFWEQLDRDQRMTAIAHEMGHKMLLHTSRVGDRNPFVWNIAGDHVINNMLVESGFRPLDKMTINGKPFSWFCNVKYKDWTTEAVYDDVYQELDDACKKQTGKSIGELAEEMIGAAYDIVSFGETPDGQKDETEGSAQGRETMQDFEQRVRKEVREAENAAKMAGNAPRWMKNVIDNADHSKVNWYDVLEQCMKSLCISDYSWARWNKREYVKTGVLAPDMWQPAMGGLALYIDCSGSCWDVLGVFNKHFKDVVEQVKPKWVEVRYFQTEVNHEYDEHFDRGEPEVQLRQLGGGGTSFRWLADEVADLPERPEAVLFLTDMYGDFGHEVDGVPVYWLSTSAVDKAPFGEVIAIN